MREHGIFRRGIERFFDALLTRSGKIITVTAWLGLTVVAIYSAGRFSRRVHRETVAP